MRKLLLYCCLFGLVSCDQYDFIVVTNRCDFEVVCDYSLNKNPTYPSLNHAEVYFKEITKKNDSQTLTLFGADWKTHMEQNSAKSLNIFVYPTDSLVKYRSIDSLIHKNIFKRLEYTIEDLENLDFKIDVCY